MKTSAPSTSIAPSRFGRHRWLLLAGLLASLACNSILGIERGEPWPDADICQSGVNVLCGCVGAESACTEQQAQDFVQACRRGELDTEIFRCLAEHETDGRLDCIGAAANCLADTDTCLPPAGSPCSAHPQCGCEDGENCVFPDATGVTACIQAGTGAPYTACTSHAQCPEAHSCVGGACKHYCSEGDSASCPVEGSTCLPITVAEAPVPGAFACTRTCNPAAPELDDLHFDPCGPGLNCGPYEGTTDCVGPAQSSATHGSTCPASQLCAPGHWCMGDDVCRRICTVGAASDVCPDATGCAPINPSFSVRDVEFGVCLPCPASDSCDPVAQCGCGSGENCTFPSGTETPQCVAAGPTAAGHACSDAAPCQKGLACVGGICAPHCAAEGETCPAPYSSCRQVTAGEEPVSGHLYCSVTCDPVEPARQGETFQGCGPDVTCFPSVDSPASDCLYRSRAAGTQGASCDAGDGTADHTLCAPGHFCDTARLVCTRFCRLPDGSCPAGSTCGQLSPKRYAGPEETGGCFPG